MKTAAFWPTTKLPARNSRQVSFKPSKLGSRQDLGVPVSTEKLDLIRRGMESRRAKLSLTFDQMAIAVGVGHQTLHSTFSRTSRPTAETLRKIADWLHRTKPTKQPQEK